MDASRVVDLKEEYIICKYEKISIPSYHKITYFIGGTYYSQESSDAILLSLFSAVTYVQMKTGWQNHILQ